MLITLGGASVVCAVATPLYIWWQNKDRKAPLLQAASVVLPGLGPAAMGYSQYEALMAEVEHENQCTLGLYKTGQGDEVECIGAVYVPPQYLEMIGRMSLQGTLNDTRSYKWGGVTRGWDYEVEQVEHLMDWLQENFMIPEHEMDFAAGVIRLFASFGDDYGTWAAARMTSILVDAGYSETEVEENIIIALLSSTHEGKQHLIDMYDGKDPLGNLYFMTKIMS